MHFFRFIGILFISFSSLAQNYPPQAGQEGSTAIHKDDPSFVAWATGITLVRGMKNISSPANGFVTGGEPSYALGSPTGEVVSLGDAGYAILTFAKPIVNRPGFDFAVFENGSTAYLELATVEVSSDGINFFKFPTHSTTQTTVQIGTFNTPYAENLHNIAGKYTANYGTPFDLDDIPNAKLLDKENIGFVKVIDVVGSIDPAYGTYDSYGNLINDSYPTPFPTGGFDLQAVGVIHQATASSNHFLDQIIEVYPNPFQEKIFFSNEEALSLQITIYDAYGKQLMTQKTNQNTLHTEALSSGIYFIEFQYEDMKMVKKMIKK